MTPRSCELCDTADANLLWQDALCRVLYIDDDDYPGFCRVVLRRHLAEMTDLPPAERDRMMRVVFAAEAALRELMQPDKINLASLGNLVPHLHWHVVPRYRDDPHFPRPIWAAPQRPRPRRGAPDRKALAERLARLLA